jgi:hypothetical protein
MTMLLPLALALLALLSVSACDYNLTFPSSPTTVTSTNTNTVTNTTTVDIHDLVPLPSSTPSTPGGGNSTPDVTLPIPGGAEAIARSLAEANPVLLQKSCQATDGADAWRLLDLLVGGLRVQDARWGYVCKDAACAAMSQDTVGYRATSTNVGTWVVDVIGNHCGLPALTPTFTWNVVGFEANRTWKSSR